MNWEYLDFEDGYLYDDHGDKWDSQKFATVEQAEKYLTDNDVRASIRQGGE